MAVGHQPLLTSRCTHTRKMFQESQECIGVDLRTHVRNFSICEVNIKILILCQKIKRIFVEVLCKQNRYWGIVRIVTCKNNCHNLNSSIDSRKKQGELTQAKYPGVHTFYWAHASITPFNYHTFLGRNLVTEFSSRVLLDFEHLCSSNSKSLYLNS